GGEWRRNCRNPRFCFAQRQARADSCVGQRDGNTGEGPRAAVSTFCRVRAQRRLRIGTGDFARTRPRTWRRYFVGGNRGKRHHLSRGNPGPGDGMTWDPDTYMKFATERTRPAVELLARVPLRMPSRVIDLGCGPGNSTALLAARWPEAELEGLE